MYTAACAFAVDLGSFYARASRNGFTSGVTVTPIAGNPYQLQVTIDHSQVPRFFSTILTKNKMSITRTDPVRVAHNRTPSRNTGYKYAIDVPAAAVGRTRPWSSTTPGKFVIPNNTSSATYENTWATLCTIAVTKAGTYHLQVKSSSIVNMAGTSLADSANGGTTSR
ncbi:MAG TPA: hypothetical protein VM282_19355 [Acidimicrobiales bacterium]|nr:hypothetical protein [Acidimicrobiales bacterium]